MSADQHFFPARTVPVAEPEKQDDKWQVGKFTFRADFDSANLHSVRQGSTSADVQLWTRRDCQGKVNERGTRTWFHFGVAGQSAGDWLALNIMNINQQAKLYGQEYRPWYWCASMADWQPIPNKVIYKREGEDFQLRFAFKFESAEEVFFAFAIPFSYRENQVFLDHITYMHRKHQTLPHGQQGQASAEGGCDGVPSSGTNAGRIYFKRQLLARSIEGRDVDLITITDCYGASSECESMPPAPHRDALCDDEPLPCRLAMSAAGEAPSTPSGARTSPGKGAARSVQSSSGPGVERHSSSPVPLFPSKKVFVITARVHPGETPATHLFNGMLAFLLRPHDARAAALRRMFVFKLVPMVNPDGVFHGHYRTDTLGQNLNRFYFGSPSQDLQPSIWAIKSQLSQYSQRGALEFYLDLHAHANRKGVFVYGNSMDGPQALESLLYSRLVALNSPVFDFQSCNFTEQNMSKPDKDGGSKEGAGRVALFRETGLTHLYTVEANYNSARILNVVSSATGKHNGRASPPNTRRAPPRFTADILQASGRAFLIAALDLRNANPWSRLPNSEYHSLQGLRSWLSTCMRSPPETRVQHLPALSDATILPLLAEAKANRGNPPWQSANPSSGNTRAFGGGGGGGGSTLGASGTYSAAGGVGWVGGAGQSRGSRRGGDQLKPPSLASARRVVSFGRTQLLPDFGPGPSASKAPGSAASTTISSASANTPTKAPGGAASRTTNSTTPHTPASAGRVPSSATRAVNSSTNAHTPSASKAPGSATSAVTNTTRAHTTPPTAKAPGSAASTAANSTNVHSTNRASARLGNGSTVGRGHRIVTGQDKGRGVGQGLSALEVEGRGNSVSKAQSATKNYQHHHQQQQHQEQQQLREKQQRDEAGWFQGAHVLPQQHSVQHAGHSYGFSSRERRDRRQSACHSSSSGGGGGVGVGGGSDCEHDRGVAENEHTGGAGYTHGKRGGPRSTVAHGESWGGVQAGVNIGEGCEECALPQWQALPLQPCALQDGVLSEYPGQGVRLRAVSSELRLSGGEGEREAWPVVHVSGGHWSSDHSSTQNSAHVSDEQSIQHSMEHSAQHSAQLSTQHSMQHIACNGEEQSSWPGSIVAAGLQSSTSAPVLHTLPAPPTLEQPGCPPLVLLPPQQHQPLSASPQQTPQKHHHHHDHQHAPSSLSPSPSLQPANELQGGSQTRAPTHPYHHPLQSKSPPLMPPKPPPAPPMYTPSQHQSTATAPHHRSSTSSSTNSSSRRSSKARTSSSSSSSMPQPAAVSTYLSQGVGQSVTAPTAPQLQQIPEQSPQHDKVYEQQQQLHHHHQHHQQQQATPPQDTHPRKHARTKRASQRGGVSGSSVNPASGSDSHLTATPSAAPAAGVSLRLDVRESRGGVGRPEGGGTLGGGGNFGGGFGGGVSPYKPLSPIAKESKEGKQGRARLQQLRQGSSKKGLLFVDGRAFQEALEAEQALQGVRVGKRESKGLSAGDAGGKKQASNLRRPSTTRKTSKAST